MRPPWRTGSGRQVASALGALGLVCFLGASCMPVRNTARRPIALGIRAAGQPVVRRLMVATLQSDTEGLGTSELTGRSTTIRSRYRDESLSEFATAVRRSGLARTVLASPVNDVPNREVLLAARSAGATHMVTSRVLSFQVRKGFNAHFAWSLTAGLILFPLLPLFYYFAPQYTLRVSATLEVAIWHVADGRRVWNRRVLGSAAVTSAQTTLRPNLHRAGRVALNVAYRRALPVLIKALRGWIKAPEAHQEGHASEGGAARALSVARS